MKLSNVKAPEKLSKSSGSEKPWAFRVVQVGNRWAVEEMTPWFRTWSFVTSWATEELAERAAHFYERKLKND